MKVDKDGKLLHPISGPLMLFVSLSLSLAASRRINGERRPAACLCSSLALTCHKTGSSATQIKGSVHVNLLHALEGEKILQQQGRGDGGLRCEGMSTDGKYAQEAVGHNMTDVTSKEKYTIYFAAQHISAAFVQKIFTTV